MKNRIIGTIFGNAALSIRDTFLMVQTMCFRPEDAGCVSNDWLARFLVTRLCKNGKTFIDIGAHIGSITSDVARYIPSAKIIAVEPIPEKVASLRRKFPSVEFHACALSDFEGETSFFINLSQSGYSTLLSPSDLKKSDFLEVKVPIRKIDTLISSAEIDVIKIDVEGAELNVLRGGEKLIKQNRPTILFESAPIAEEKGNEVKRALYQWFVEKDYAILIPNRLAHNDPGVSLDGFLESHLYPLRTLNYFAVAKERRIEIRDLARKCLKINVR